MTATDVGRGENWEETLRNWGKPANEQQEARADRTAKEVRDGLSEYPAIPNSSIRVFAQGSKRNNTDVQGDCDVDIAVELQQGHADASEQPSVFDFGVAKAASSALTKQTLGLVDIPRVLQPPEFKQHVLNAMVIAFDAKHVSRHDKCIKVDSTRLTIPADVVPCYPYRHYVSATHFEPGIMIYPDSGEPIINYPEQHYRNGVAKNSRTGTRYKKIVRCLKCMERDLVENGQLDPLPSFFIESLVYNCPDGCFASEKYVEMFVMVTASIYGATTTEEWKSWVEVNGIKSLFLDGQTWTPEQASQLAILAFSLVYPETRAA